MAISFVRRLIDTKRDILFVLDGSGSIGDGPFQQALKDLQTLVGLFCHTDQHRFAMLQYATHVDEIFNFGTYTSISQVQQAIGSVKYMAEKTATGDAFAYAKAKIFNPSRGII